MVVGSVATFAVAIELSDDHGTTARMDAAREEESNQNDYRLHVGSPRTVKRGSLV